jgi:hypothetical protein
MPTGKITDPEGPGGQGTLGQVLCTNGNTYLFHNTADLKKEDPVIFFIDRQSITIEKDVFQLPIAKLHMTKDSSMPCISQNNWDSVHVDVKEGEEVKTKTFKQLWDEEWASADVNLNLLPAFKQGKSSFKLGLLNISNLDGIRTKNPQP